MKYKNFFPFLIFLLPISSLRPLAETAAPIIFSDPAYSQPNHNFSAGETIYVKVVAGNGEKQKVLRLLNDGKQEITRYIFNQSGNVYTINFSAPEKEGIYYIDVRIEGEGSSFASQQNINIGSDSQSGYAVSSAESKVVAGKEELSFPRPSFSPAVKIEFTSKPLSQPPVSLPSSSAAAVPDAGMSFFQRLIEWFKHIIPVFDKFF